MVIFRGFSILSIVVFGLCVAEKLDLPVPICKRDSSNYNSCLKRAIKEAWPLFVKGIPEFDFPPLDPFFYKYQKSVLNSDQIRGEITVYNLTVEGLGNMRFSAVRSHFDNDTFRIEIDNRCAKLFVNGTCKIKANLAGFQLNAKGKFNLTMGHETGTIDMSGPVKDDTWIIEHFQTFPTIKNLELHLDDMFEGNREINELAATFINEYWPPIYRVIMPIASKYWNTYFSDLFTRFFAKVSFSKVFPE